MFADIYRKDNMDEEGFSHYSMFMETAPSFGDANTPTQEVRAFYKYWKKFESHRSSFDVDFYGIHPFVRIMLSMIATLY